MKHKITQLKNTRIFLLFLIIVYLAFQFVGPRIQLALIPNFDTSCFSGAYSMIEKVSKNSSCGASPVGKVGFPFVFNFEYNPKPLNVLVFLVDMLPVVALLLLLKQT